MKTDTECISKEIDEIAERKRRYKDSIKRILEQIDDETKLRRLYSLIYYLYLK